MPRFIWTALIGVFAIGILIIGYLGYIEYRKQIEKPRNPWKILYHYSASDPQQEKQSEESLIKRKPLFPGYERVFTIEYVTVNDKYCMPMATRDELFNLGVTGTCLNEQEFLFLEPLKAYALNGLQLPDSLPEEIKKQVPVSLEQKFEYFLMEKRNGYAPCAVRLLKTSGERGLCTTFTNGFAIMLLQVGQFGQNGKFSGFFAHKSIIWKRPYIYT